MEQFPDSTEHGHTWPKLDIDLSGPDGNVYAVILMARRLLEGEPLKRFNREIWEATQVGSGKTYGDMLTIVNSYMDLTDTSGRYEAYAPQPPEAETARSGDTPPQEPQNMYNLGEESMQ